VKVRIPHGQLRRTLLTILLREGRGMDTDEMWRLSMDHDRKRVQDTIYDMTQCGVTEVCGERKGRSKNGKPMRVYRITAMGREWLEKGIARKPTVRKPEEGPRYSTAIFEAWPPRSVAR
jgi:hypothetical protein